MKELLQNHGSTCSLETQTERESLSHKVKPPPQKRVLIRLRIQVHHIATNIYKRGEQACSEN